MTAAERWNRTRYRLYAPIYDWVAQPFERGRQRSTEFIGVGRSHLEDGFAGDSNEFLFRPRHGDVQSIGVQ